MLRIFCSDTIARENKLPSVVSSDGISSSQSASGHQTAWFGAPGQRSMADIVKMGIPQNKTTKQNVNMRSEISHEHEVSTNQQVPVRDEWPTIEKPLAPNTSSISVAPAESEVCNGPTDFQSGRGDQHLKDRLENIQLAENDPSEIHGVDHVQADSFQEDDSAVSSEFDDNPYQTHNHPVEHQKGNILKLYNCFPLLISDIKVGVRLSYFSIVGCVSTLWVYAVNDNVSSSIQSE